MGAFKYLSSANLVEYLKDKQTYMMTSSGRSVIHRVNSPEGETVDTWEGSKPISVHANCGDFVLHVVNSEGSPITDSLGHIVKWVESAGSFSSKFTIDDEGFAHVKKGVHNIILVDESVAFPLSTGELTYAKKGDALDITENTVVWNYSYTVFSQLFEPVN